MDSAKKALDSRAGLFPDADTDPVPFNGGLRAVAYKPQGQIFLSSKRNYFGGIRFKRVKLDHGADGVLLYFPDIEAIEQVGRKFLDIKYTFRIETGFGIGSTFPTLTVSCRTTAPFKLQLCKDLLPNNKAFQLERLKFILCQADIDAIASSPALDHVRVKLTQSSSMDKLRSQRKVSNVRRSHVLIGQSVLRPLSLHEHEGLHIAYDYDLNFAGNYDELCSRIRDQLTAGEGHEEAEEFFSELAAEPNNDVAWDNVEDDSADQVQTLEQVADSYDIYADRAPELFVADGEGTM